MELIGYVICGVMALGLVLQFVQSWRGQSLADRRMDKMVDVHTQLVDNLACAANPEAWLAQQADAARKERREEAKQEASKETPEPKGIF